MKEYLWIKWYTIKEISVCTEKSMAAYGRYIESGPRSMSAATHVDTPAQKRALCDLIDAINGEIKDAGTMETTTKEKAKRYLMSDRT